MNINDYSFHDSTILKITEDVEMQALEMLLDFPVDWENNQFEHRILRFNDVTDYTVHSIGFVGDPTILEIEQFEYSQVEKSSNENFIESVKNRIQIITNAGKRTIVFGSCELLKPTNL